MLCWEISPRTHCSVHGIVYWNDGLCRCCLYKSTNTRSNVPLLWCLFIGRNIHTISMLSGEVWIKTDETGGSIFLTDKSISIACLPSYMPDAHFKRQHPGKQRKSIGSIDFVYLLWILRSGRCIRVIPVWNAELRAKTKSMESIDDAEPIDSVQYCRNCPSFIVCMWFSIQAST